MKDCPICDREFKDSYNLKRHLDNKISCIEKINKKELCNKILLLYQKIENMENKSDLHDINVNVTNNNGNINVTNNIITNNITIDVNLLGQENIDFLYGANFLEACLPNMPGMKDLLELIHASKEHPENHNIYLKNSKQNVYFIKTDKGKELISCNELSKKILDINIDNIVYITN